MSTTGVPTKVLTEDEVIAQLRSGMTIGIGGWGSRRKPMSLVRAILRSSLTDLTIVSYGGPDVGLLCAAGKVSKVVYGFVSLDSIAVEPGFAAARQSGSVDVVELDEGMLLTGLTAAAHRLPFQVTRTGLGSDALTSNPHIRTISSPYDDETLVAMPALRLDAALVHLNRADQRGNGVYLGPDPYFDDLFCLAADRAYLSVEEIVDTADLLDGATPQMMLVNRAMVAGVVEAPRGAHFTSCVPEYERDEAFQRHYVAQMAASQWETFRSTFLEGSEDDYQRAVGAWAEAEEEVAR